MTAVPLAIDLVCAAPPFNSSPAAVFIPLGGGGLWSAMESMAIAPAIFELLRRWAALDGLLFAFDVSRSLEIFGGQIAKLLLRERVTNRFSEQ
jgi:hypothetical protein